MKNKSQSTQIDDIKTMLESSKLRGKDNQIHKRSKNRTNSATKHRRTRSLNEGNY